MHELAPLIKDLAIMLGVASLMTLLFQKMRQPVVLGYLVAGMVIGPYTPWGTFLTDFPNINTLSELGVIFLMFALGLEFSFHKLTKVGFSAAVTGSVEVVVMLLVGFFTGKVLGWSFYDCIFLGAALAISSTTIIIKALEELRLKNKRFAELIFGMLIVEDLLAILLLVGLTTVVNTKDFFSVEIAWAAGKLLIIVGGWFLVGYFLVPSMLRKVMPFLNAETLTITAVGLCLVLVCLAVHFHYSPALGAFIMGSILAETPLIHRIEQLILPIRDIFAAVFFISVGMLINPLVIITHWPAVLFISAVTIISKIIATSSGALLTGQSLKTSTRVGFGMAQIGEFSFIIAGLGVSLKVTNSQLYPLIVAVSALTTFTTPYLIKVSGYVSEQLENKLPNRIIAAINHYSGWIYRSVATIDHEPIYRGYFFRLIANGIMVILIFTLTQKHLLPIMHKLIIDLPLALMANWLTALLLSSFFIWGMLFSFKTAKGTGSKSIASPVVFLGWLFTTLEILVLSSAYFYNTALTLTILIAGSVIFGISYRKLERSYHWFERRLVKNMRQEKLHPDRYQALAPWDTHLIEIQVSNKSRFIYKSLAELHLRERFGINIVAIYRGAQSRLSPRGNERLFPQDRLVVLGNDEQIDAFSRQVEDSSLEEDNAPDVLSQFSLKAICLEATSILIGQSIREAGIREQVNGQVVGLERDSKRVLNPDPATPLEAGDLLILVGETEKLKLLTSAT